MQENSCTKKLLMFCFWCANKGRRVTGVLVGTAPPMVLLLSFFSLCLFSFLLKRQWESTIPSIRRLFFAVVFFSCIVSSCSCFQRESTHSTIPSSPRT
ncbi:hypothetical protein QR685DRAFT_38832 [Neurospora intermedia]|uniref:Uncharacterized protein n=1 Tax=Neurospora intermedia TaxID=5142 RepID=A0ABR3DRA6_NEUIN